LGDPSKVILAAQAFRQARDELLGKERMFELDRRDDMLREVQSAQARFEQARAALRAISRS